MTLLRSLMLFVLLLSAPAGAADFAALVGQLPTGSYGERADMVRALADPGDARAVTILGALMNGSLFQLITDKSVVILDAAGAATDALSGAAKGTPSDTEAEKIKVNNALRGVIRTAIGVRTQHDPDPGKRLAAAGNALRTADPDQIPALDAALKAETDPCIAAVPTEAQAAAVLKSDAALPDRLAAVVTRAARGNTEAQAALAPFARSPTPEIAAAVKSAIAAIAQSQRLWSVAQNVWFGLSLGSVLLAAIGLAITFGVMGVINMAHGELVMPGPTPRSRCRT